MPRKNISELRLVAAIQGALQSALEAGGDEHRQIPILLDALGPVLSVDAIIYWRVHHDESGFERKAQWAKPESSAWAYIDECTPMRIARGIGHIGQSLETPVAARLAVDANCEDPRILSALDFGLSGAVTVPVVSAGRLVAVIEIFGRDLDSLPSPEMQSILEQLLSQFLRTSLCEVELRENEMIFRQMSKNIQELGGALKESARKERVVVEQALDVICSLDASLKILKINPACMRTFGREPVEMLGCAITDFVNPDHVETTISLFEQARQAARGVTFEDSMERPDGSPAEVSWSVYWSDPESSFFCVAHDISDRKELEKLRREFVAMISHDIRTPLMSVNAVLTLLQEGVHGALTDKGKKRVGEALSSVHFVVHLINSILDLEQLGSGKYSLEMVPTEISSILGRAVETVAPLAEKRGVKITFSSRPAHLKADETRLLQVVVNLLGNAVKFSPDESGIEIDTLVRPDFLEVRVIDHGRGIPEEHRKRIFDRFAQVENADATKKGGSGLGLAICKEIIELHGGSIGVDSEEGKGSTFWFRLPQAAGGRR